ncbi:MAG TPA: SDR family NAD(P)-dependent oxidoreductase [Devosia sp.]|nr:SDR family NAD(P)-dependent oxidoreductase [Devosia sp.]
MARKRAWITGAGSGIGRALAKRLADQGWDVAVSARTASDLDSLVAEAPGRIWAFVLDVTDSAANRSVVDDVERTLGPLDLVVLNAGGYFPVTAANFSAEKFRKTVELNLNGTANGLEPVLQRMVARGRGHVAVMASVAGFVGLPTGSTYSATKAALNAMCEALKVELEPLGVTLTVINPGFVKTPATDKNKFPMPFRIPVEQAAEAIMRGLERKKYEIIFPWQMAIAMKLFGVLPHWLQFTITRRMLP